MVDNDLCQLYFKYGLALSSLNQKLITIYNKYLISDEDNPIEHLKYRIKSADSIEGKLLKLKNKDVLNGINPGTNYELTSENIEKYLDDIVGYRVVCPFISDVYKVVEEIKNLPGIEILEERDYIKRPKLSGYSSYHLKIAIPVQLPTKVEMVKAEIQVRTITMDMLNSLEHKINYKKNVTLLDDMQEKLSKTKFYCKTIDKDLDNVLLQLRQKKENSKKELRLSKIFESDKFNALIENKKQALSIINDKIELINNIYINESENNPIEHVKTRIKSNKRIIEKLVRQNKDISIENIESSINDIAGVRIICTFLDDVVEVINELKNDLDIKIIQEQDFIDTPKENGYSSYHMLVEVPIETKNGKEYTKVEIQIRTMPQEMWAILQERLCYQKEVDEQLPDDLKRLANVLADVDINMNEMIKYSRQQQELNKKKKVLSKVN